MNISNLQENQKIKNYNELCLLLEIDIKTGKSKQLQIKDFERYFSYTKQGHTFIIDKIFEKPLEKHDDRQNGNNSQYIEEITDILIDYIYTNQQDNKVYLSFSRLIDILGLVNESYDIAKYKKKELSDLLKISLEAVHYFFDNSRSEFKKIIKSALNNLQKRSIIQYFERFMILEIDEKDGETIKINRLATDEEVSMILDAQRNALDFLKVKDFKELFLKGRAKYAEFNKLVKKELPEKWVNHYHVYEIIMGQNAIKREYESMQQRRLLLNTKSIEKMKKTFGILNEKDTESRLIDTLIDLLKHDIEFDEKLTKMYKANQAQKYKAIASNKEEIITLAKKQMKLSDDIKKTIEEFETRDVVDNEDYNRYSKEIKDRKCTYQFMQYAEENTDEIPVFPVDLF